MDLAVIESTTSSNSHAFNHLSAENYPVTLKKSIQELVDQYVKGVSDFSAFRSTFFELMQSRVDPPLESIWVFSALSFQNRISEKGEPLDRVSTAKDLFQFFSACSASCSGSKSIALLAPLVLVVYTIVIEIWDKDQSLKREKKIMREIESLSEAILGFINLCCYSDSNGEEDASIGSISSLVNSAHLWMNHGFDENGEMLGSLKFLFPLVSDEIRARFSERELGIGYLAGVVVLEVFLLRVCLKFRAGVSRSELQKDLRTWAVGSISGFQSYYFFDILARMLLEPNLPVTSLLNSEDEILLRKIIYDAVILVEYSFLKPERVIEVPAERMRSLAITRLIVTHEAIHFSRKNGDQTRAISYVNAFSSSSLPSLLIKCVTSQFGRDANESRPNGSTPKALIKWLLDLENQRIRIFNDSISRCRAKLVVDISRTDYDQPLLKEGNKNVGPDLTFYMDNEGEQEHGDGPDRKRKKCRRQKKKVKFLKYNLSEISNKASDNSAPLE